MEIYSYDKAMEEATAYFRKDHLTDSCCKMHGKVKNWFEEQEILLLCKLESFPSDRYNVIKFSIIKKTVKEIRELGERPQLKHPQAKSFFEEFNVLKILENYEILSKKELDPIFTYLNLSDEEIKKLPENEKFANEIVDRTKYLLKMYFHEQTIRQTNEIFKDLIHANCPYQNTVNRHDIENKNGPLTNQIFLSKAEVLRILPISESTLNRMRKSGKINFVQLGDKKIVYKEDDINRMLQGIKESANLNLNLRQTG